MGLLSKAAGADRMMEVLQRVRADLQQQLHRGSADASTVVPQHEVGTRFRLDTFSAWLAERLSEDFQVMDCSAAAWTRQITITVRAR